MADQQPGPFTGEEVAGFLADHGYVTHPKGMAGPFWPDCEYEDRILKYFDVNADAVRRKNGEVPARPLRITVHKVPVGGGQSRLEMKSVEELGPGIKSKALDRQPETPRMNAPWPS